MAAKFPFIPDWAPEIDVAPRISKVDFGDGLAQRFAKGLNAQLQTIKLTFSGRTDKEAAEIIRFFEEHGGTEPFTAQIGFNSPVKNYVTEGGWTHTIAWNEYNHITVTFQEVP
jgi:phage-related protein